MLTKKEFWVSGLLGCVTFVIIGYITSWNNFFTYMHVFNAITIIVWCSVLYITLTKGWSKNEYRKYIIILIVSAIPHTIGLLLSYGSMICLSISIILTITFYIKYKKQV